MINIEKLHWLDKFSILVAVDYVSTVASQELGGFLLKDEQDKVVFKPIANHAEDKEKRVLYDLQQYLHYVQQDKIIALVHSHPENSNPEPSLQDLQQAKYCTYDWIVLQPHNKTSFYFIGGQNDNSESLRLSSKAIQVQL